MLAEICRQFRTNAMNALLEKINKIIEQDYPLAEVYEKIIEAVKEEANEQMQKTEEFVMSLLKEFADAYFEHCNKVQVKKLVTAFVVFLKLNGIYLCKSIEELTEKARLVLPKIGYNLVEDKSGKIFVVKPIVNETDKHTDFKPMKIVMYGGGCTDEQVQRLRFENHSGNETERRLSTVCGNKQRVCTYSNSKS